MNNLWLSEPLNQPLTEPLSEPVNQPKEDVVGPANELPTEQISVQELPQAETLIEFMSSEQMSSEPPPQEPTPSEPSPD